MAANWITFSNIVVPFLNNNVPKTEMETAKFIANSYKTSIMSSMILGIPGSSIIQLPPTTEIELAIVDVFMKTKQSGTKTIPIYYMKWAQSLYNFWMGVQWSSVPPAPGYVLPTTGVTPQYGGDVTTLSTNLFNAFNNPPANIKMGNVICTKLIIAFQTQLTTISGFYNGMIPSPNGVVVGPPYPWIGIM